MDVHGMSEEGRLLEIVDCMPAWVVGRIQFYRNIYRCFSDGEIICLRSLLPFYFFEHLPLSNTAAFRERGTHLDVYLSFNLLWILRCEIDFRTAVSVSGLATLRVFFCAIFVTA